MVEHNEEKLSVLLKAVSDATRRALLTQLCQQGASRVTDIAMHYQMSLNAISKHIKVLEKAGLVNRRMHGRVHWIEANLDQTELMSEWLGSLQSIWTLRLQKLDQLLQQGEKT